MKKQLFIAKISSFAIIGLFCLQTTFAQTIACHNHSASPEKRAEYMTQSMAKDLELSRKQTKQIGKINLKYAILINAEYEKNREQAFLADKATLNSNIDALQVTKASELQEVLSEEQYKTHLQLIASRYEKHKENVVKRAKKGNNELLREELRAYKLENIIPVMQKQRAKLDEVISEIDKSAVENLRPTIYKLRKEIEAERTAKRQTFLDEDAKFEQNEERHTMLENGRMDMQKAHELAEKYEADIERLNQEIKEERKVWKAEMKKIAKKHIAETEKPARMQPVHAHEFRHHKENMKTLMFLMLDYKANPADLLAAEEGKQLLNIKVFPIPSDKNNTIEWVQEMEGNVKIELYDISGRFVRSILDEGKTTGKHQVNVDVSDLNGYHFYYKVVTSDGETIQRFLRNQ
ncbi:MAG: hypothetical protein ACPG5B_08955 [Chitinophagales bacterium]